MKLIYKLLTVSFLPMFLFSCADSMVDENPTKKSSTESSSSESSVPSSSSSLDPEEEKKKTHKILFIGNSFTHYNDIEQVTEAVGKSLGLNITCERVATSAYTLADHVNDFNNEQTIAQKIKNSSNAYTHIILQEHSTTPLTSYSSFLQAATTLKSNINQYQPNAKISLYETWGFQSMADARNKTIPECEEMLFTAYNNCGKALNLNVNYVGRGFTTVYQTYPEINIYHTDNKHPSFAGTYLASLIHIMSITGIDVRDCTYVGSVSNENATKLKNVAYNVVTQYGTNPNQ